MREKLEEMLLALQLVWIWVELLQAMAATAPTNHTEGVSGGGYMMTRKSGKRSRSVWNASAAPTLIERGTKLIWDRGNLHFPSNVATIHKLKWNHQQNFPTQIWASRGRIRTTASCYGFLRSPIWAWFGSIIEKIPLSPNQLTTLDKKRSQFATALS